VWAQEQTESFEQEVEEITNEDYTDPMQYNSQVIKKN
jgi:hypothetical protein